MISRLPVPSPLAENGLPQSKSAYDQSLMRQLNVGLKGLWPLQETSGTTLKDSLGVGDATITGTATVGQAGPTDFIPYSVNFNTGYATTGYSQVNLIKYSMACWFKTTATSGMVFGGRTSVGVGSLSTFFGTDGGGGGGNGRPRLVADGNSLAIGYSTIATYNDGNWHHGVWVCDTASGLSMSNGHMRIYIDGAFVAGVTQDGAGAQNAPFSSGGAMQIAANGRGTETLVCNLAMVSVWERVLSEKEAAWLYRCATGANR